MAARNFYILNTVSSANQLLQFQGAAPSTATTTVGWQNGTRSNQYSRLIPGQTNSTFNAQSFLDNDTSLVAANSFSSNVRLNGKFLGNWIFTARVIASTTGNQSGRLRMRIWASSSVTGLNARELTTTTLNGTTVTTLTTTTAQSSVITWSPTQPVSINNEYLFFQSEWHATAAGSNANSRTFLRIDSDAKLVTGDFVQRTVSFS
jgi:hypothetical protein